MGVINSQNPYIFMGIKQKIQKSLIKMLLLTTQKTGRSDFMNRTLKETERQLKNYEDVRVRKSDQ